MKLSPGVIETLASAKRRGIPTDTACELAGVSVSTFNEWLRIDRDALSTWHTGVPLSDEQKQSISALSSALRRAQAEWEAEALQAISEYEDPKGGKDWRSKAWLLNNHPEWRHKYRQHREQVQIHQGQISHEHTLVRQMSDEQLDALGAHLAALPAPDTQV
jgi:hypothetical protein